MLKTINLAKADSIRTLTKNIAQTNLRLSTIKTEMAKLEKERNERTIVNNHNVIELSYLNWIMKLQTSHKSGSTNPIFYDYEYDYEVQKYSSDPHSNC